MTRLYIFLLLALLASPAAARQDPILPDLAPREVEITGDLSIVFPTLRRQPIVGFNPPPRVPDISSDRRPFTEAYKQPSADLPPSPMSAPEPPSVSAMARRTPISGVIDLSAGRFLDRALKADITLAATEKTSLLISADYFGTEGRDVTIGGVGTDTGRDRMSVTSSIDQRMGGVVVGLAGSAFKNSYSLFGAVPAAGVPSRLSPDRTFSGYDGTLSLNSRPGSSVTVRSSVTVGTTTVDTDVFDPAIRIDPVTNREESFLKFASSLSIPLRDGSVNFWTNGATSGLDSNSFPGSTIRSGIVAASWRYLYSVKLELEAGATVLGFDSKAQSLTGASRSLSYFAPILRATYSFTPAVKLTAETAPTIDTALSRDLFSSAPFMMDEPLLLPSLTTIDATVGLSVQSEFVSGSIKTGYKNQPFRRFPVQTLTATLGYVRGYSTFDYSDVDVLYVAGDVTAVPASGIQVGVDFVAQNASVTSSELDVPHTPGLGIGGFASASFLDGDAEFRIRFEHESKRTIDALAATSIPSVTRFHIMLSYFFHPDYALMTGVRDLGGGPVYWDGYEYESDSFYLGLRYRW